MERREKVNAVKDLAVRSGQWISFSPDRWGENMLDSLEAGLQKFLTQLPEEVRDEYEDRYIEKYKEWLCAMSRCVSQAITGAGGWTAAMLRRKQKNDNYEKAARERLDKWCEKIIKRCNRQERLIGWAEVERLQEKIDNLRESHEMMKMANKIIRNKNLAEVEQVDELISIGFNEQTAIELLHPKYDWCGQGFSSYQLSRKLADIKDAETKMKRHMYMANKQDEVKTYEWGELHICYSDERYRFVFDGKPAQEIINLMKSNAFKWSRANLAWQRQITTNAKYAVQRILGKLNEIV